MAYYLMSGNKAIMYFGEGYILTDIETLVMGAHFNTPNHRFIFKTLDSAYSFIRAHKENPLFKECYPTYLPDSALPNCNRECRVCNKKKKDNCKNLRNPMQAHCGFRMASFKQGTKIDPNRLDASCEKCITKGCPYNMSE